MNTVNSESKTQTTAPQLLTPNSYASIAKGNKGLSRIAKATGYSIDGFKAAYKFEAAFRQVFWLNSVLFIAIILIPYRRAV